jgi:large subunit ribosomal protein L31
MKAEIHPTYQEAKVECSCGNTFLTRSTKGDMHVELCNECHPFFTGRQKLVDTGGRVERFRRRYEGTEIKSKARQKSDAAPVADEA